MKPQGKKFLESIFSPEEKGVSLIGEGLNVVGTLDFGDGVLRLDGRLEGKIIGGGTLIVGEKGKLEGEAEVGTLIIAGQVRGKVSTPGSTHIAPTGKLFGKIQTTQLVIEKGGIFDGEGEARKKEDRSPEQPEEIRK